MLNLPALLIKAFMAVEGANPNSRDGVLQVTPATRQGVIARIPRALKLAALNLSAASTLSDAALNNRFGQAFANKDLLVQTLTGAWYIKEQLERFEGYVALAGLAYNVGPARAQREVKQKWGGSLLNAALQYHKRIGKGINEVTVHPGIPAVDAATGAKWIRYPVTANDTKKEIFQYLYLRQVPRRNFGLLDFIFRPALLERTRLFFSITTLRQAKTSPIARSQSTTVNLCLYHRHHQLSCSEHTHSHNATRSGKTFRSASPKASTL